MKIFNQKDKYRDSSVIWTEDAEAHISKQEK